MSPEPFDSRAKAPPAKGSEKGYGDENGTQIDSILVPSATRNTHVTQLGVLSREWKTYKITPTQGFCSRIY